ncbi:ABC transporter permease, partial [Acidobacteriota bacterium]
MFLLLVEKELKAIVLSPKFAATFAICSVLILLSVFVGTQEYHQSVKLYEAVSQLSEQEMQEASSWMAVQTHAYRIPDPLQIFASGVNYDIGRFSSVNSFEPVKLRHSVYADDPIFAVFRFVDLAFIFQVVLSMFGILFTYDAINGERETGTLKLVFSNSVPRAKYILAKLAGSWLGLIVPLLIPILIAFLIPLMWDVPLTGTHWKKLAILCVVSLIYFTFFIVFGLFVSSITKRSSVSFLIALVAWVVFVLIVPRTGVMIAGQIMPAPSAAEIDSQIDGFSKDRWNRHMEELTQLWHQRNAEMEGMTDEERETYRDDQMWDWMEKDDLTRKSVQADIVV